MADGTIGFEPKLDKPADVQARLQAAYREYPFLKEHIPDPRIVGSFKVQRIDAELTAMGATRHWDFAHVLSWPYSRDSHDAVSQGFLLFDEAGNLLWRLGTGFYVEKIVYHVSERRSWWSSKRVLTLRPAEPYPGMRLGEDFSIKDCFHMVEGAERTHFVLRVDREGSRPPKVILYKSPKGTTVPEMIEADISAAQNELRRIASEIDA